MSAGYGSTFFLISGFFAPKARSPINARVYAFALGGRAPKPDIRFTRIPTPRPPTVAVTPDQYAIGGRLYGENCLVCHGIAAIGGGVLPDLRKSGRLQDAALWRAAVVEAALASKGMPRFERQLSAADAELVRAYVARQAAMLYDEEQSRARAEPASGGGAWTGTVAGTSHVHNGHACNPHLTHATRRGNCRDVAWQERGHQVALP